MLQILKITSLTLFELCDLPKRQRHVFVILFAGRNFKTALNWTYYKSRAELAEILDMKEKSVFNAISELQKAGWLSKPETKTVPCPNLSGKLIRQYRWRFPKHEAEFEMAKDNIEKAIAKREAKRHDTEQAIKERKSKANGHKEFRPSEITEKGLEKVRNAFD